MEIKFREWEAIDDNEFGYSFNTPLLMFEIENLELFTGIEDRNMVEVYEKDILKHNNTFFVVTYSIKTAQFVCSGYDKGKCYEDLAFRGWDLYFALEQGACVVGNVHEGISKHAFVAR